MVRVLRVPDAKFRDKVHKSLRANLTTLHRELGQIPRWEAMTSSLVRTFERVLGPLVPASLPAEVQDCVAELARTRTTEEWLLGPDRRTREGRQVKIASGVHVFQRVHKAPGGLIRATVEMQEEHILDVTFTGDFFFYPADSLADLEEYLAGTRLDLVEEPIEEFYRLNEIESPGVTPRDLSAALGTADAPG
jgi:lipoate-protein ligase A